MNQFSFFLLLGAGGGGSPAGGTQSFFTFAPFIAIIAIFYFLIIRPQNKKQKETQRMLSELKKGDKVVTIGGVHGVIQSVRESAVIIKVDEDCKIEFTRSAIATVEPSARAEKSDAEDKSESDN